MDFLGTVDAGCGVAIDGAGRIVVAGDTVLPSTVCYRTALTALRLLPDGTPDTAFAGDGSRIFKRNPHIYLCSSGERDVRLQAHGSIVLAGRLTARTVIHLTKGGALDTMFGDGGIADVDSVSANWGFSPACRMTTDAQGNIVIVSRSDHRVGSHWSGASRSRCARCEPTGRASGCAATGRSSRERATTRCGCA
jgi:hypothetical protein